MNLSKSIRIALAERDLKQLDLAAGLGVQDSQVSRWVTKNTTTLDNIKRISKFFKLKVSEFIKLGED